MSSVLGANKGLKLVACCDDLAAASDWVRSGKPDIVLFHLTSSTSLADLGRFCSNAAPSRVILWGDAIGGEFAYQTMLLGIRAIIPSHTSVDGVLTTLRNVHRGVLCFEKELVDRMLLRKRVTLTKREGQIVSLVAQGYKNKAIGNVLGITEGTVKVYLYKLFKKLGVNDRLDMALYSLRNLFGGENGFAHVPDPCQVPVLTGPRMLPPMRERVASHRVN